MTRLEKKMDILIRVVCAEDEKSKKKAMKELREMPQNECAEKAVPTYDEIRDCAEGLLLEVGVSTSLKGFECLVEAVALCAVDKTYIDEITKRLYRDVATNVGTTPHRAERSMRHAVEVLFNRCDTEVVERYFGNCISLDKGKPTNSEFISRMAKEVFKRVR